MTFKKIPILFTVFFILLSVCIFSDCYADYECGFDTNSCPYRLPPCYKVVVSGVQEEGEYPDYCDGSDAEVNGEWMLKYASGCAWLAYSPIGSNMQALAYLGADPSHTYVNGGECGGAAVEGSGWPSGSGSHWNQNCNPYGGNCNWGGGASWEPIWDCSECGMCDAKDSHFDRDPNICYDSDKCCPNNERVYECLMYWDTVGSIKTEATSSNSDVVKIEHPGCVDGAAKFIITTIPADPEEVGTVTVTLTGDFFYIFDGDDQYDTRTEIITIGPAYGDCCEERGGKTF